MHDTHDPASTTAAHGFDVQCFTARVVAVWAAGTHEPMVLLARPTRGQVVVILSLVLAVAAPRVRVASPPSAAAP